MPRLLLSLLLLVAFTTATLLGPILGLPAAPVAGLLDAPSAAHAQSSLPPLPGGWPSTLQLGRADSPGGAAALRARAPFGFRYQYLAGGVNTGNGWATWNPGGEFATYYIQDSVANGLTPVFTYYMIYQSAPGGGGEQSAVLTNLNTTSTMQAYYADLKLFFQRAGAFPNNKVVLHVEPDLWGYVQQVATNDNAASVPAKVGSTGVSELAGLTDNVAGMAQGIVRLRNQYAPNVLLGYHVSVWGTGVDIGISDPSDSQVDQLGNRAGAFYTSLGASFDVAFGEYSDRDSGFKQAQYGQGAEAWWNADDFRRFARFIGRFVSTSGKRMVLWQIPLGNTKMRAVNNTWNHYQDNRVEWLLDEPGRTHLSEYVNAGVIGFLFGRGADGATDAADSSGDGVTNPAAINGNTQTSYNADDDGGFFHNRAAAYYSTGAMGLPAGSGSPPTSTPTPVPGGGTPTPVVPPGSFSQTAGLSAGSVQPGGSVTITAVFASGNAGTLLTDIEVYSAGNTKMHQQFFDGQTFSAGQHRTYQTTWNVPASTPPGTYTVTLGMFSAGWGSNLAWNANAAAINVVSGGGPSPVSCSPRPPVSVSTTPSGSTLRVDLTATGQNNRLQSLQFTQTSNALIDINGQSGRTGAFTVGLPGDSAGTTFTLRRAAPGAATAMLTVVDGCGSWSTFVGGGPNGF